MVERVSTELNHNGIDLFDWQGQSNYLIFSVRNEISPKEMSHLMMKLKKNFPDLKINRMHLMRTTKFSSLPFFAKGKKNSFVSYPNKFNNKFIDMLKRGGHDPILGKMGKIRLGSRERACYISVICPIQFRFHPRVLLFHTSDENGPEGELEWEI